MKEKAKIVLTVLFIGIAVAGALWFSLTHGPTYNTVDHMEYIQEHMRGDGTFVDYGDVISVQTIDDLGWWEKQGYWYVMYGKLQLVFDDTLLRDTAVLELAQSIGLKITGNLITRDLHFYWFGEEIAEWVPN